MINENFKMKNEEAPSSEATEDKKVMRVIRRICNNGDNVEVHQTSDGKLKIYAVKKRKEEIK